MLATFCAGHSSAISGSATTLAVCICTGIYLLSIACTIACFCGYCGLCHQHVMILIWLCKCCLVRSACCCCRCHVMWVPKLQGHVTRHAWVLVYSSNTCPAVAQILVQMPTHGTMCSVESYSCTVTLRTPICRDCYPWDCDSKVILCSSVACRQLFSLIQHCCYWLLGTAYSSSPIGQLVVSALHVWQFRHGQARG